MTLESPVTLQTVASLMSIIMTLAKTKAKANKTSILQASLMIITYAHQNSFIVKAIGLILLLV